MVQESEMDEPVAEFAAEAAARRLPLKRQCAARLRARAEPRVYPRPCEAAVHCPFTGRCRAAGLPAHMSRVCNLLKIGRASCRERVEISVVAVSVKKKKKKEVE